MKCDHIVGFLKYPHGPDEYFPETRLISYSDVAENAYYSLPDGFYQSVLDRFEHCPRCGAKLNWKDIAEKAIVNGLKGGWDINEETGLPETGSTGDDGYTYLKNIINEVSDEV